MAHQEGSEDPPWPGLRLPGVQESSDKGCFNIGEHPRRRESDSSRCMSRGGSNSNSMYLVGSLSFDEALGSAEPGTRRTSLGSSQAQTAAEVSDGFGHSRSDDPAASATYPWSPAVGQVPDYLLRRPQEALHFVETRPKDLSDPRILHLQGEVAALLNENSRLSLELNATRDVYRHKSMPELASSSSLRSTMSFSSDPHGPRSREFMPSSGYDAVDLEATMVLVLAGQSVLRFPPNHLVDMPPEDFKHLLQRYIALLEDCCRRAQSGVDDKLQWELSSLINEVTALTLAIITCNPAVLQSTGNAAVGEHLDWESIMELLNLTSEQKQQLGTMKHLYECASQQLANERSTLLSAAAGPAAAPSSATDLGVGLTSAALKEHRLQAVLDKLKQNVERQHRNLRLLADGALRQVLSPLQAACAFIYSYPRVPDMLAMVQLLDVPPLGTNSPSAVSVPRKRML